MVPDDPLDMFRTTRRRCKATLGPPSPRTDDMARFNEARLGKPSHVLSTDSLRQFLVRSIGHSTCTQRTHSTILLQRLAFCKQLH